MKKAFTLIEVLVVIAIIAILAGLLLPVYHTAQRKLQQPPLPPPPTFNFGDLVVIGGINATGVVKRVWSESIDIINKDFKEVNVPINLLRKVNQTNAENQ